MASTTRSTKKIRSVIRHLPLVFVIIVTLSFVTFALAQESDVNAGATVDVNASAKPMRPLDIIRAKLDQVKQTAVGARQDLKVQTQAQLQGAQTPEEKQAVMKNALGARVDIAQDRIASTTGLRMQLKALVRQHAGLIKERFSLALRQFDNLIARMNSRVAKLKAQGVATASVEADISAASAAEVQAKADVQAIVDFIATIQDSSDRTAVKTELQTLIKTAQTSIKAAHDAIAQAVRSLVALVKQNAQVRVNASTSVETNSTGSNDQ